MFHIEDILETMKQLLKIRNNHISLFLLINLFWQENCILNSLHN